VLNCYYFFLVVTL